MWKASRMLTMAVATGLFGTGTAIAALPQPVIWYNSFPSPSGTALTNPIVNSGSSGINGTLNNTSTGSNTSVTGPATSPYTINGAHFDDGSGGGGSLTTGIYTGGTLNAATGVGNAFTMSAWVNLDTENGGDNMVFGTDGGNPVHLGFRGDQAYFGFWGNDSNSTNLTGNGISNGGSPVGNWNFFQWSFDPSTGTQSIYENGVSIDSSAGHGGPGQGNEKLEVATNGNNGGDLAGSIADVRIYNTANISATALYASAQLPEPATIGLLGAAGIGFFVRRRRS